MYPYDPPWVQWSSGFDDTQGSLTLVNGGMVFARCTNRTIHLYEQWLAMATYRWHDQVGLHDR